MLACAEIARRYQPSVAPREAIRGPSDALAHLAPLRLLEQEKLVVLLLDIRLCLVAIETVATGSVAHVSVRVSEIFTPAVAAGASALVLAHNHPSGDANPSPEDAELTRAAVAAGAVLDIDVIDHMIVTRRSYYSFRESRRIHGGALCAGPAEEPALGRPRSNGRST